MLCRPELLSLSVHGCSPMNCPLNDHLAMCVCLDICDGGVVGLGVSALIKVSSISTQQIQLAETSTYWRHL